MNDAVVVNGVAVGSPAEVAAAWTGVAVTPRWDGPFVVVRRWRADGTWHYHCHLCMTFESTGLGFPRVLGLVHAHLLAEHPVQDEGVWL